MRTDLIDQLIAARPRFRHEQLRKPQAGQLLQGTLTLMFPHFGDCPNRRASLLAEAERVEADLQELLAAVVHDDALRAEIINTFFSALGDVARRLNQDAEFIAANDPAAKFLDEVILAYPGFFAIAAYRIAHVLYTARVPIVPRLITEYAHERTGIDIHPGATIGSPFFIDHGTGIVVGETTRVGERVKLYQGVTLGAMSVRKDLQEEQRHPTIEDDVVIYASATVLGGDTRIGRGSVIGGNVWLTESIPPQSVVVHKSEVRVRHSEDSEDGIEFHI